MIISRTTTNLANSRLGRGVLKNLLHPLRFLLGIAKRQPRSLSELLSQ